MVNPNGHVGAAAPYEGNNAKTPSSSTALFDRLTNEFLNEKNIHLSRLVDFVLMDEQPWVMGNAEDVCSFVVCDKHPEVPFVKPQPRVMKTAENVSSVVVCDKHPEVASVEAQPWVMKYVENISSATVCEKHGQVISAERNLIDHLIEENPPRKIDEVGNGKPFISTTAENTSVPGFAADSMTSRRNTPLEGNLGLDA